MKYTFALIFMVFGLMQSSQSCGKNPVRNSNDAAKPTRSKTVEKTVFNRLPENIKTETQVSKAIKNAKGETVSYEITTVEKALNELGAGYKNNVLVDGKGREIRFYEPLCRGVSRGAEGDDEDRRAKENELAGLEKNYTVVVLYCDPRQAL